MMSKLKSPMISSSGSLVLAVALLAFSFAFGVVRSHAETISCPPPALDIVAELAEEFDVLCQSQAVAARMDTAEAEVRDDLPSVVGESPQPVADASIPSALEGQAIHVEITQTVTVAALGQELATSDEPEITGTVPSSAAATEVIFKPDSVALDRTE